MKIATYVVVDPSSNEGLLRRILKGIAEVKGVPLTIETIDEDRATPEVKEIEFYVRQSDHELGYHNFIGFCLMNDGNDPEEYIVNVSIPPWDEPASVKVAPRPV